jgi:lipopolysaccharide biosynthesis regulator YciM
VLINIGEPSRLIRTYRSSVSSNPQNDMLRFFLGKLYYRLEMIDDALETLSSPEMSDSYPELHQLMGELYIRRSQCDEAVAEFRKSINMKKTFRLPYICGVCGHSSEDWSGRCSECGNWNTFQFNLHGTDKA